MSLFVLASKDGWVNIMYNGLDAVAVDQQVGVAGAKSGGSVAEGQGLSRAQWSATGVTKAHSPRVSHTQPQPTPTILA